MRNQIVCPNVILWYERQSIITPFKTENDEVAVQKQQMSCYTVMWCIYCMYKSLVYQSLIHIGHL